MENDILFVERQKFKQWWLWLILLGVNLLVLGGVYQQIIRGQPFGDKPASDSGLVLTAGLVLLFTLFFMNFRLDTQIRKDGIYVRFFPFHFSFRYYSWQRISKAFIRTYNPVTEYGGWGIRFGIFGKGKAFNVSGNQGLQLEFDNSKKLLIGTNKPIELAEALAKIGELKP